MENIQKIATKFPIFKKIEDRTDGKLKQEYSLIIFSLLCIALTLSTRLGPLLTSTAGLVIPLKETLTILKQMNPQTKELKHLLIFWMIFGVITALDSYSSWITGIIPFFYTFKLLFLLWAGPLKFGAGEIIYDKFVSRIPEKYYKFEGAEDGVMRAAKIAKDVVKEGKQKGINEGIKTALDNQKIE